MYSRFDSDLNFSSIVVATIPCSKFWFNFPKMSKTDKDIFKSKSTPMSPFLRNYFLCFYAFGVYFKYPFSRPQFCRKLLSNIPRIIHLICVLTAILLYSFGLLQRKESVILLLFLRIYFISNIIFVLDGDSNAKKVDAILLHLFQTENYLNNLIDVPVCLSGLKFKIHTKMFISVILIVAAFFAKSFSTDIFSSLDTQRLILMAYRCWAIFLLIILIDYRNFLLFSLNQKLNAPRSKLLKGDTSVWSLINLLCHIRNIHFKICKITSMINSRFGWYVIIIFLDNVNIITSTACFTYMELRKEFEVAKLFRN